MEKANKSSQLGWWILIGVSLASLIHVGSEPFIARQYFGLVGYWMMTLSLMVLSFLVALRRIPLTSRDLAMLLGGFLFCWLILSPCFFYSAKGKHWTPQPYANAVASVASSFALGIPAWGVVSAVALRRKWVISVPLSLVQCWMGFVNLFMTAGIVTGSWL